MVFVRKFSQFVPEAVTEVVGLTGGANAIGPNGGGGGSGGVSQTFPQQNPPLALGKWVRPVRGSANAYTLAQADDAVDGEAIGVVTASNALTFTIQQSGYINVALGLFNNLIIGGAYFLDPSNPGNMVPQDATINNQITRPVFVTDSSASGWVVPYRPLLVGGVGPNSGGNLVDSNIQNIPQNGHGFSIGDWVRVSTPPNLIAGQAVYVLAVDDSLSDSQSVGVVTAIISANEFTIQFAGYNVGAVTVDFTPSAVTPATVYYLSAVPGQITSIPPSRFSKPLYICEQTGSGPNSTGVYSGWILPQRPLDLQAITPTVHTIVQANSFHPGQWVYISGDTSAPPSYALAIATSLASSQVAGVVISSNANQFTVQQDGWISGAVTGTYIDGGGPVVSGEVYYLSALNPGFISTVVPSGAGQYTKPCYVQETVATNTGEILPQRPLSVSSGSGGAIVQAVYNIIRTNNVYGGGGGSQMIEFNTTITPTSAANFVLIYVTVTGTIAIGATGASTMVLTRNGITIPNALNSSYPVPSSGYGSFFVTNAGNSPGTTTFVFVDNPASTSALTYGIVTYTSFYLNTGTAGNAGISSMILQEIT